MVRVPRRMQKLHWQEWTGVASSPFGQDSNQDGLADGLAWLLGAENPATQASLLLPQPERENDSLSVTFHYLPPALRGSYSLRLQASTSLAPDSWSEIAIPDTSASIDGVVFAVHPLPDGKRHEIKATFPPPPNGRIFVRLSSSTAPAP